VRRLLLFLPFFAWATETNTTIEPQPKTHQSTQQQNQESFLLEYEYGRMLYNDPRGVSCAKCHGKEGKGGQKIAKYYDKDKNPKILKGVDITNYTLKEIEVSLENRYRDKNNRLIKHKIMPIYYLTKEEIKAIYTYLQHVKKKTN